MEETWFQKIVHAIVFLGICAAIIGVGWHEPLRYRFMNTEQIAREEVRLHPPPPPPPPRWDPGRWNLTGTSLDRAPWDMKSNQIEYHPENLDSHKMGLPTEADRRGGTIGKQ
ncbi:MAG TPA: hypothetical protein VEO95_06175 [Chthoniobacteraceae bacterium]|nr:hypothetical protein [Chthoniobacteraceae bacterium]